MSTFYYKFNNQRYNNVSHFLLRRTARTYPYGAVNDREKGTNVKKVTKSFVNQKNMRNFAALFSSKGSIYK